MAFVVYFFVLLITAGSVLFGLDWVSAPMTPMPASKYELRAAKPPAPPRTETAAKSPTLPAPVQTVSRPAQTTAAAPPPAPLVAPEPAVAAAPPPPKCDINACASAYRSFTASDCTYQPLQGPRRLCEKGTPPSAAQATPQAASSATPVPDARAQAACNIAACSQAYFSFTASDCTWQPLVGPRRLCEK